MKKQTNLWVLTCVPKSKKSTAKERKIFINGDMKAVEKMIAEVQEICGSGEYKFAVSCSNYMVAK